MQSYDFKGVGGIEGLLVFRFLYNQRIDAVEFGHVGELNFNFAALFADLDFDLRTKKAFELCFSGANVSILFFWCRIYGLLRRRCFACGNLFH